MDPYFSSNVLRFWERLAELNTTDLRECFKGFRTLYNELLAQREGLKAEIIVQHQSLMDFKGKMQKFREYLAMLRRIVAKENLCLSVKFREIFSQMKEDAPQLALKLEELQQMQRRLAYLKFSKNFALLLSEVRKCLRKANYSHLMDNYKKLLKIPSDSAEYCMDAHCRHEFAVKSGSLTRFLQIELRAALSNIFSRIHFPFEEPVDLNSLHFLLHQSAQIVKCLQLVTSETFATTQNKSRNPRCSIELIFDEFRNRFDYHFYGERPTNNVTKPEWFFTQLSYWADSNVEYFEQYIQPIADELFSDRITERTAKDLFLQFLMSLASQKVFQILGSERILENRHQLAHLIDETVFFEKEFQQNFGYSEEEPVHVVSQLCNSEEVLEKWIKLERDTLWAHIDEILADDQAYEPRYKEAADVDPYLLPNFADSFIILMQSMSERYRSIPELRLQCRFLKLQLVIVDEFRSRIVQIGQNIVHNPREKPYPQLMNALWYLSLVLDDWSESPEFVRLQFHIQSSVARGTFDESAGLYRHVWHQWKRNVCDGFVETFKLTPYMACSIDNTALFRARAIILCKKDESLGNGEMGNKGLSMGRQRTARTTEVSTFSLYCQHARRILTDITELRDLVLDKRKEYILCSNTISLYGVQKFMSDEDRRKFEQNTDLAFKHCTKLIKGLEAQIESDRALRPSDQLKHLRVGTNLLNIYLKEVLSIFTQLRAIHVRKTRQIRRVCRLANLVEMYEARIEQSEKEEEAKALKLTRMLEELKEKEASGEEKENVLNGSDAKFGWTFNEAEKKNKIVVDGWEETKIEEDELAMVKEEEEQPIKLEKQRSKSVDGWEEAHFMAEEMFTEAKEQPETEEGWKGVRIEEDGQSKVEQPQLLEENKRLFERFTATDSELTKIEAQMSELHRLQGVFAEKISEQEQEIDVIHSRTVYTLDNLEAANEFVREAIKNQANRRVIIIFCLLVLTFTLLFLDWYNP